MNMVMDLNEPPEEDESSILFMLMKDGKQISQVSCSNTPVKISEFLHIKDITSAANYPLKRLPRIYFHSASQNRFQHNEWQRFLNYLLDREKVAICQHGNCKFLITPPAGQGSANWDCVAVAYCFEDLTIDGEAEEYLVSAEKRARESVLVRGENAPKSHPPALHIKGSNLIVTSADVRRQTVIREDACLRSQNSQFPSPRFMNADATRAISSSNQEDSLNGFLPVKEEALYQKVYPMPDESMLAQGGRTHKPQTTALNRALPNYLEAREFLISADNQSREPMLVHEESVPKSSIPALRNKGSHMIVNSEDFRRPRVIREDSCLKPQNYQSPSSRLVSGDATCAILRDCQEDYLDAFHPVNEKAMYQKVYSLPDKSMLAQGGRTPGPQTAALNRELRKDGGAGEFLVSADNRTRETVLVRRESEPKSHTSLLNIKGSQSFVKSEDFRRPRVITEDACLRPQNSPSTNPSLVSGDASCRISRDYRGDGCHLVKEQGLYQTIDSLPGETILAQGESASKSQTAALHRQQSQVIVKSEDLQCEDFTRARNGTEDAFLNPQNTQPVSPGLVSGDAACTMSRAHQEFSLHNPYTADEQALYEKIYSLPRAPMNFKEYMQNASAQMPLENPFNSLREVKQEISDTDRVVVTPEYMNTVRHMHNGWPFGALAELIDNARDANASKLEISIQMEFNKNSGQKLPVLSVIDNGMGMSHSEIIRMVGLGHSCPTEDNRDQIGRFGVGFKAGSMQLGMDVVVLTQCRETRSIAFLSRSYNANKKELVIPIITYRKEGGWMDFDLQVHSKAKAEAHLESIKKYSPFNEYTIGSKFGSFAENGTGTHISIYNLARYGSDYTLAWDGKCDDEKDIKNKRDIWIRSRMVRERQGQVSREVPLDYSLHSYLEVMFLNPRMKIYVQGTVVRTCPLARSLNKTKVVRDVIMGKNVELILGRSQQEKERGNCGMFLYWHGRLIEAYKRVGGMVQSADMGRGVIGVMDVTDLMNVEDEVMVLPTKQGFAHCEALHLLVRWLGCKADEYWDENFDTLDLRDNSKHYKPDHEWVQCNKCRKWRILDPSFNADLLPPEWFCFMLPFKGTCDIPEQKVEQDIITVSTNRYSGGFSNALQSKSVEEANLKSLDDSISTSISNKCESSTDSEDEPVVELPVAKCTLDEPIVELPVAKRTFKRIRRGPPPSKGVAKRSRVK